MVSYERRDEALWIVMDRTEKKNALNLEEWRDIKEGIKRASDDARAAVITGTGDTFSAGDDLDMAERHQTVDEIEEMGGEIVEGFRTIEEAPVPVIAAVNGICLGAACEIVVACDLAIAVQDAEIGLPEVALGIVPAFAVTRFPQMGGRKRGMELSLLAESIDAETAREWGLVNRVVPADELEETVRDLTETIADHPERAVRLTKRYANTRVWDSNEHEQFVDLILRTS